MRHSNTYNFSKGYKLKASKQPEYLDFWRNRKLTKREEWENKYLPWWLPRIRISVNIPWHMPSFIIVTWILFVGIAVYYSL